jgi:hypothetical protein
MILEMQMPSRLSALLFLNGVGLFIAAVIFGWVWFFHLLGHIVLWPIPIDIPVDIPGDERGFRMGHMEAITQGLMLMALGLGGRFMRLTEKQFTGLFWSALVTAWLFTLPAMAHPFFGTRGLAFGGGPFKGGLANDTLYLLGWPPVIGVHIMLALAAWGLWRHLKAS